MEEVGGRFERTTDGQWMLTMSDGSVFVRPTMQELVAVALPNVPDDLREHLAARDSGDWSCAIPDPEVESAPMSIRWQQRP